MASTEAIHGAPEHSQGRDVSYRTDLAEALGFNFRVGQDSKCTSSRLRLVFEGIGSKRGVGTSTRSCRSPLSWWADSKECRHRPGQHMFCRSQSHGESRVKCLGDTGSRLRIKVKLVSIMQLA